MATDNKNWIKKVKTYLNSRDGKSGVPLSYLIHLACVNPETDEYARAMWVASFETQQFLGDNCKVCCHLFIGLLTKDKGATWFEKVKYSDGWAAH